MLVDDGSPDNTAAIAEALFASDPRFSRYSVLRRTGPRGLGRAYRDGFRHALEQGFDLIIQMDADLSHDPSRLPALVQAAGEADLVIGSRYCKGGSVANWPLHRVLLSRFACWYVRQVASIPVADATAGYRCWTRKALGAIEIGTIQSEGYSFQVEMAHRASRAGLRIQEAPIRFVDRRQGRSKISRAVLMESFLMPWALRFHPWQPRAHSEHPSAAGAGPG
jgi:dolichol-phosphate mannosyltransferase